MLSTNPIRDYHLRQLAAGKRAAREAIDAAFPPLPRATTFAPRMLIR